MGSFLGIGAGDAGPLDAWIADAVLEAQGGAPGGELLDVLLPDHLHTGAVAQGLAGARQGRLQPRVVGGERGDDDVDVRRPEGRLPVGGGAVADVAQGFGAGRHALLELERKAVQRRLGYPEGTQAVPGEGHGDPGVLVRDWRWGGRCRSTAAATRGTSRPACRSSTRRKTYLPTYGDGRWWSAPLWMSSISTLMAGPLLVAAFMIDVVSAVA